MGSQFCLRSVVVLMAALGLGGCASFQPEALQPAEIRAVVETDRANLNQDMSPPGASLSLEEAIARAIKYNAERRFKAMEEAVAQGNLELGRFDMLPKLMASAGYRYRNNDLITRSEDSVTGAPSLANPYISSSRETLTTDLSFSWSLLDFGQSYFAAKQNADRVLIAAEHNRKAIHTLIQDVRTAYWRVVAAEHLGERLRNTVSEAEAALAAARQVEEEKLRSPLEPLRYQRQLLENLRLLEAIDQELSTARIELAALTQLPLAQANEIKVIEPSHPLNTAWLEVPVEQLEEQVLQRNPEFRESIYNARIARQETRRALLKLFPGLSFNYAQKHSNDSYLIHRTWNEVGAQVSLNLLGLLSAPAQMRLAEAGIALADQKRMATQMAVLAQLHVARLHYLNAKRQFDRADMISGVDHRIAQQVNNLEQAERQTRLERVSQQTAAILSVLRRYQALSLAQAAASRLQATLGLEANIQGSDKMELGELTKVVAASLQYWNEAMPQSQVLPEQTHASVDKE